MATAEARIPWAEIDTVLVDMDGTLLDLAFDNFFWLELVPTRFGRLHGLDEATARASVTRMSERIAGTLPWYCIDHWSNELGMDLRALKREHRHLIRYLPMVPEFLAAVRARGKRLLLVTNAHRATLQIKVDATGLDRYVDECVCSHDLEAPKESGEFWSAFIGAKPFDPTRTLLLDDSVAVLRTAREFGVSHAVAIRRPDSSRRARVVEGFSAVDGVASLV